MKVEPSGMRYGETVSLADSNFTRGTVVSIDFVDKSQAAFMGSIEPVAKLSTPFMFDRFLSCL